MAEEPHIDESSSDEEFFDTASDVPPKSENTQTSLNVGFDRSVTAVPNAEGKTGNTEEVSSKFNDRLGGAAILSDRKIKDNLNDAAGSVDTSLSPTSESVDPGEGSVSSSNLSVNYADKTNQQTSKELETGLSEDTDGSTASESVDDGGDHSTCSGGDQVCEGQGGGSQQVEEHEGLAAEAAKPDEKDGGVDEDEDGEEALRQVEDTLTQEEKEERKDEAQKLKKDGNDLYKDEEYADAIYKYSEALKLCPLYFKKERSIMFANRAACKIHLKQLEEGVKDCTKALDLHPHYMKVLLRRAQTYELLEKLEEALTDYQRALELDPGCHIARAACMRLPDEIKEKNEKLKAEMMEKLKDLGNMVLRPFGLSTDNFQVNQDPNSGSYSVNFVQKSKTNGK